MLKIIVKPKELWDEINEEFITNNKETVLQLEHSLVSVSKWESKYCKPFYARDEKQAVKTDEEILYYIKCMTITQNVGDEVYKSLSNENIKSIKDYIDAPMTATTFSNLDRNSRNREVITSELIYYWMIALNIPMECQKWHLNRLLTLIRICNIKNTPPKKVSKRDLASKYAALNAARRKQFHTNG